ncbi:TPA: lactoylglutathione lyase [Streptococcus suis]|nr:lactoylglutathione lyase [Streptococcus suis]HEM3233010.1 lactoylglutathione lyase [Streptococcus suis 4961]HEL2037837.1 lactoylglutathione lyase [Streptococcus suis]HEM2566732.1 lactoylglutathione lyase [Streptococcus suis]HEM2574067.1 lactoylglutathione lyase [Streptococcus suis]
MAGRFYEAIGFAVATFGDIKSVTLPEGGNLILMQADSFAQRVPFQVVASGNEVLISLNVASRKEVDTLIERVEANSRQITGCPTDARGFYGASFTDLDGHHFNVIVM